MRTTRAIGLVIAVGACARPDRGNGDRGNVTDGVGTVHAVTDAIDFGDVPWTETVSSTLTLRNDTDAAASVSLVPSSGAFVVEDQGPFTLASDADVSVLVEWDAGSFEELDASIEVRVDDVARDFVPVRGISRYPRVALSSDRYDLGERPAGCSNTLLGVLSNEGIDSLDVSSFALVDEEEFALDYDHAEPTTPFSIPAHGSILFHLIYTPTGPHESSTAIRVASNDPITPSLSAEIVGRGLPVDPASTVSLSWTVPPAPVAITALLDVNGELIGTYEAPLLTAMGRFLETLDGTGIPFRLAIVPSTKEKHVDLSTGHLDNTLSAEHAIAALTGMLQDVEGDADDSLQRLESAVEWNLDWVVDDDPLWHASSLALVAINFDVEQSPEDANFYVERYQTFRDDPADVVVHGIAGPPPAGCAGGPGAAFGAASEQLLAAVDLTGGRFASICDDWTSNLEQLAFAMQGLAPLALTDRPVVGSISLDVDGIAWTSGWSYASGANEIVFDDGSYPPVGSVVEVQYTSADACE